MPGLRDIAWFDERGYALPQDAWHNHDARALTSGKPEIVMMFINGSHEGIAFDFPQIETNWFLLIDSSQKQTDMRQVQQISIEVPGKSTMLFGNRIPKELQED